MKNQIRSMIKYQTLLNRICFCLINFVIAGFLSPDARAETLPADPLEEVLEVRHTKRFLATFMVEFEEAVKRRQTEIKLDELVSDKLLRVARRVYRTDNLYEAFKHSFGNGLAPIDSTAIRNWSKTPVGTTVGEGFQRAFDLNAFNHTWAYMRKFEKTNEPLQPSQRCPIFSG